MDARIVVGVGNIYAYEALFDAAIDPRRPAGELDREACRRLVAAIKQVLRRAITQGGTTLRGFVAEDSHPKNNQQQKQKNSHTNESSERSDTAEKSERLGQRATYFCADCQR